MQIHSLLNPEEGTSSNHATQTQPSTLAPVLPPFSSLLTSQSSITAAAMVSTRPPELVVNYDHYDILAFPGTTIPPDQAELAARHKEFRLSLRDSRFGIIRDNTRRIPYSSVKTSFLVHLGRECLEVFEYEFRIGDTKHHVLWDYNIGLVRITPFFKACGHSKTIPVKALGVNPDLLQNLSLSITGGAITAQGYWVPFECAKAMCKTFCYNIRWALTPIFGTDFVDECIVPGQHGYGSFKIDDRLVREARRVYDGLRKQAMLAIAKRSKPKATAAATSMGKSRIARKSASLTRETSKADPEASVSGATSKTTITLALKNTKATASPTTGSPCEDISEQSYFDSPQRAFVRYGNGTLIQSPPVSPKTIPNRLDTQTPASDFESIASWRDVIQLEMDRREDLAMAGTQSKRKKDSSVSQKFIHTFDPAEGFPMNYTVPERVIRSPPTSPPAKKQKKKKPAARVKARVIRSPRASSPIKEQKKLAVTEMIRQTTEAGANTSQDYNAFEAANILMAMQSTPRASLQRANTV